MPPDNSIGLPQIYQGQSPLTQAAIAAYNQATLQGDKGFRLGYALVLESFPFVTQPSGA